MKPFQSFRFEFGSVLICFIHVLVVAFEKFFFYFIYSFAFLGLILLSISTFHLVVLLI